MEAARTPHLQTVASLHKTSASLPELQSRCESHAKQVEELEQAVAVLRRGITEFCSKSGLNIAPSLPARPPSLSRASSRSVSFGDLDGVSRGLDPSCDGLKQVRHYDAQDLDAFMPAHGHWLPRAITSHRDSFRHAGESARILGGRVVQLDISARVAHLEGAGRHTCTLVEPQGKILSPTEFATTGLVVCVHSDEYKQAEEDWADVLRLTKWLDMGLSFALLEIELGSGQDWEIIEASVRALLERFQLQDCVLVSKGAGAQLVAGSMLDGEITNDDIIAGAVLLTPGEVPGRLTKLNQASQTRCPSLLFVLSADCERRCWTQTFKSWPAPVAVKDVSAAGHDLAALLSRFDGEAATTMTHFTVAVLLSADLKRCADEPSRNSLPCCLPDRTSRLCDELPIHLAGIVVNDDRKEYLEGCISEHVASVAASGPGAAKRMLRIADLLDGWVKANCYRQLASASE